MLVFVTYNVYMNPIIGHHLLQIYIAHFLACCRNIFLVREL
jgi:hypothetical protein